MPIRAAYNSERLKRIASSQYNVITRDQALECDLTRSMVAYRIRPDGPWHQVLPGVYLTVTGVATPDQRDMAALLYAGPGSVITGPVAVRRHRLSCAGPSTIDVLVPASRRRKSTAFVQIQRTTRMPEDVYKTGPIQFAPLARAVADASRGMSRFGDVEALVCETVQKGRCSMAELTRELDDGSPKGSRLFHLALNEVRSGIWSTAEGDAKRLIDRSGVQTPMYNALLFTADGTFVGCADAWWPRAGVALEVDSRQYHLNVQGFMKTMDHHNRMAKAGIVVLHWLPSAVKNEPEALAADLRDAVSKGNSRPSLPIRAVPSH